MTAGDLSEFNFEQVKELHKVAFEDETEAAKFASEIEADRQVQRSMEMRQ